MKGTGVRYSGLPNKSLGSYSDQGSFSTGIYASVKILYIVFYCIVLCYCVMIIASLKDNVNFRESIS